MLRNFVVVSRNLPAVLGRLRELRLRQSRLRGSGQAHRAAGRREPFNRPVQVGLTPARVAHGGDEAPSVCWRPALHHAQLVLGAPSRCSAVFSITCVSWRPVTAGEGLPAQESGRGQEDPPEAEEEEVTEAPCALSSGPGRRATGSFPVTAFPKGTPAS